jgi:DNA-binding response OmpR family regulator
VAQVLVVEDDPTIRTALVRGLTERGHAVASAPSGLAGLEHAVGHRPDVVVLDLGLPDVDGTAVLRMLRGVSQVPVVVATARDDEAEIVAVLDAGADDYVVKPFSAAQLDARIRAVLRRGGEGPQDTEVVVGGLRIDPRTRQASVEGRPLRRSASPRRRAGPSTSCAAGTPPASRRSASPARARAPAGSPRSARSPRTRM